MSRSKIVNSSEVRLEFSFEGVPFHGIATRTEEPNAKTGVTEPVFVTTVKPVVGHAHPYLKTEDFKIHHNFHLTGLGRFMAKLRKAMSRLVSLRSGPTEQPVPSTPEPVQPTPPAEAYEMQAGDPEPTLPEKPKKRALASKPKKSKPVPAMEGAAPKKVTKATIARTKKALKERIAKVEGKSKKTPAKKASK